MARKWEDHWSSSMADETAEHYLMEPHPEWGGLNKLELNKLAKYNGERSRGILHSEEWKAEMAKLQERFDGK